MWALEGFFWASLQEFLSELLQSHHSRVDLPRAGLWSAKCRYLIWSSHCHSYCFKIAKIQQASHSCHLRWISNDVCSPNLLYFSALQALMWIWLNWQNDTTVRNVLRFHISNKFSGDALVAGPRTGLHQLSKKWRELCTDGLTPSRIKEANVAVIKILIPQMSKRMYLYLYLSFLVNVCRRCSELVN